MKFKIKLPGDGTTLLAALLLSLSVHGSNAQCTTTTDSVKCVQTMTCEELVGPMNQYHCRHDRYGQSINYETNIIFTGNDIPTESMVTGLSYWENSFYRYYNHRQLNLLSLQHNALVITPLIRTPTTLCIKHIDLSHNFIRSFDLKSLHNVNTLQIFDLSYNFISDLYVSSEESSLQPQLSVLNLSHNQIDDIKKSIFTSFTGLRTLDLSHNNISYVNFQSFIGLGGLTSLNLSFNALKEFNMALFELRNLEHLDISFNQLSTLYKQDLMKAANLKQLNIQNNNLKSLDPQMFSILVSLEELNMGYNHFGDSLDDSFFKNNVNLVSVDLSSNGLSSLVRNAFSSQALESFEVNGNMLSGVLVPEYFNGMHLVTTLDLSKQYLTGVSNNTFTGVASLETLNLSRNMISSIEYKAFANLFNLTSIDLSYNRITVIDFRNSDLVLLNSLKVKHNLITSINANTFENLNALEELDISHNYIEHLCAKCLPLESLIYLRIENNTFSKIDSESFVRLSLVSELDFSNFRLTGLLNTTFKGLDSATELNISNNRIEVVEQSAFRGLMNLTSLDMSTNFLDSFIVDALDLPKLVTLNLYNNRISTITSLGFHNLEVLDLSNNELHISFDSFDSLPSLRLLMLSNNSLSEFVIPNLRDLSRLDLANNNLHIIRYSSNRSTNLREIILTSNKIQDVKLLKLAKNSFLEEINLSENVIDSIDALSVDGLKDLRILDLSNNLVPDLAPGLFVELQHLEVLNISHNKIKEIKFGAFNGLNDLQILDVSFNYLGKIHIDIFVPLTLISHIALDNNKINTIEDINAFVRPLATLSLGGNPLDCRWLSSLLKLIASTGAFKIQAQQNNFTSENLNGITCVRQDSQTEYVIKRNMDEENNAKMDHDIRPHLSNLTQSLRNILDKNTSFTPENNLAPYLLNATNLLEKILNKNYSFKIDNEDNVDLYAKKHYNQMETYMNEIIDQLKHINNVNSVSSSEIVSQINESKEVSVEVKGKVRDSGEIKELKDEIVLLKTDLVNSLIARDQKFDSLVANLTKYLDINKSRTEPVESSGGLLSQTASDKLSAHGPNPDNYDSRIKLTEAFVVIILVILLSVITYKLYLSKVVSGSRQLEGRSFQNIPMD